jgi:hypothetical protein
VSCEDEPSPSFTRSKTIAAAEAVLNSRPMSRQWCAPGAVCKAASPAPGDISFGMSAASAGVTRPVAAASSESGVEVRTVIHSAEAPLSLSVNGPVNAAPASTTTVSPGCAASSAA